MWQGISASLLPSPSSQHSGQLHGPGPPAPQTSHRGLSQCKWGGPRQWKAPFLLFPSLPPQLAEGGLHWLLNWTSNFPAVCWEMHESARSLWPCSVQSASMPLSSPLSRRMNLISVHSWTDLGHLEKAAKVYANSPGAFWTSVPSTRVSVARKEVTSPLKAADFQLLQCAWPSFLCTPLLPQGRTVLARLQYWLIVFPMKPTEQDQGTKKAELLWHHNQRR